MWKSRPMVAYLESGDWTNDNCRICQDGKDHCWRHHTASWGRNYHTKHLPHHHSSLVQYTKKIIAQLRTLRDQLVTVKFSVCMASDSDGDAL